MSWNMDVQNVATNYPYKTSGSFMEYVEDLTYDHVNFIFSGTTHDQVLVQWPFSICLQFGRVDPDIWNIL